MAVAAGSCADDRSVPDIDRLRRRKICPARK